MRVTCRVGRRRRRGCVFKSQPAHCNCFSDRNCLGTSDLEEDDKRHKVTFETVTKNRKRKTRCSPRDMDCRSHGSAGDVKPEIEVCVMTKHCSIREVSKRLLLTISLASGRAEPDITRKGQRQKLSLVRVESSWSQSSVVNLSQNLVSFVVAATGTAPSVQV